MKTSIVISTYNSPAWLEKVLLGYSLQTFKDFEIVIADDGSTESTAELITAMRQKTGLSITHVWHEDKGFRKCAILNKAVTQCRYDYVIFTDGDCIPRRDFVNTHIAHAEPNHYLSGTYFKLPMSTSQTIDEHSIVEGSCFTPSWLYKHGLPRSSKVYKIACPKPLTGLFNRITPTKCNLKGSNASVWKSDILAVNGFDERMPWGGEDREFGVRLLNHGVKAKHVRFNAVVIHLDHARGYVDRQQVEKNKALRLHNEKHKVSWTEYGISNIDSNSFELR